MRCLLFVPIALVGCQEFRIAASTADVPEPTDAVVSGAVPDDARVDLGDPPDPVDETLDLPTDTATPDDSGAPVDTASPTDSSPPTDSGDPMDADSGDPTDSGSDSGAPVLAPDCAVDPHDTLVFEVDFAERDGCAWGTDGNLGRQEAHNTARHAESAMLSLPDGATLCTLAVSSTTGDIEFDDHLTVTLGDVLLLGGGSGYEVTILPEVEGLLRWDWNAVRGTQWPDPANQSGDYWCLGGTDSACTLPRTDEPGPFAFSVGGPALDLLVDAMEGVQDLDLSLRTFGDNDDHDCRHTDMSLEVEVGFVR